MLGKRNRPRDRRERQKIRERGEKKRKTVRGRKRCQPKDRLFPPLALSG